MKYRPVSLIYVCLYIYLYTQVATRNANVFTCTWTNDQLTRALLSYLYFIFHFITFVLLTFSWFSPYKYDKASMWTYLSFNWKIAKETIRPSFSSRIFVSKSLLLFFVFTQKELPAFLMINFSLINKNRKKHRKMRLKLFFFLKDAISTFSFAFSLFSSFFLLLLFFSIPKKDDGTIVKSPHYSN